MDDKKCRCCDDLISWAGREKRFPRDDMCESCARALSYMHQWLVPMGAPARQNGVLMQDFKAPEFSMCNQHDMACHLFNAWQDWPKKSRTIKWLGLDRFTPNGQLYDCYATSLLLCLKLQLDGDLELPKVTGVLERNSHGHRHIFDLHLWIDILGRDKIVELSNRFTLLKDADGTKPILEVLEKKCLPIDEDMHFIAKKKDSGSNKHLHKRVYKGVLWSSRLLCGLFGENIVATTSRDFENAIRNSSRVADDGGANVLDGANVLNGANNVFGGINHSNFNSVPRNPSISSLLDFDSMELENITGMVADVNAPNAEQRGIDLRDGIVYIDGEPQDPNLMDYMYNTWHMEQIVDALFIDKTHIFKCENAQVVCETMSQEFYNTETGVFRDDKFMKWIISHVMGWTELTKDHDNRDFKHSIWHYVGTNLITKK